MLIKIKEFEASFQPSEWRSAYLNIDHVVGVAPDKVADTEVLYFRMIDGKSYCAADPDGRVTKILDSLLVSDAK